MHLLPHGCCKVLLALTVRAHPQHWVNVRTKHQEDPVQGWPGVSLATKGSELFQGRGEDMGRADLGLGRGGILTSRSNHTTQYQGSQVCTRKIAMAMYNFITILDAVMIIFSSCLR